MPTLKIWISDDLKLRMDGHSDTVWSLIVVRAIEAEIDRRNAEIECQAIDSLMGDLDKTAQRLQETEASGLGGPFPPTMVESLASNPAFVNALEEGQKWAREAASVESLRAAERALHESGGLSNLLFGSSGTEDPVKAYASQLFGEEASEVFERLGPEDSSEIVPMLGFMQGALDVWLKVKDKI